MAKMKYDGVVEAAHYRPDGQLDWVRVYERRGAVFSDRILLSREEFIKQLKAGKRYMVGERIPNLGGKFNINQPVRLLRTDNQPVIALGNAKPGSDDLTGVPII
jgi:hypothetical protein